MSFRKQAWISLYKYHNIEKYVSLLSKVFLLYQILQPSTIKHYKDNPLIAFIKHNITNSISFGIPWIQVLLFKTMF